MREILFKAKRIDNGEWVEGYYLFVKEQNKHYILTGKIASYSVDYSHSYLKTNGFEWFEIDPNTLCQFTGLKDKNGKMIFENDILEFEFEEIGKQKAVVYYNLEYGSFLLNVITDNFQFAKINDGIVIGNRFDNPELLGDKV